jgi:hypothetical protein
MERGIMKKLLEIIRSKIGAASLPDEAETYLDEMWVRVPFIPRYDFFNEAWGDYQHEYCYQKLEQSYFGKWGKVPAWRGSSHSLDYAKRVSKPELKVVSNGN